MPIPEQFLYYSLLTLRATGEEPRMDAYSNLVHVLSGFGETGEIERAYIVKLGCVRLLEFEEPEQSCRFPLVEFAKISTSTGGPKITATTLHSEILRSLREHPNVFDIAQITDKRTGITNSSQMGLLVMGNLFSLKVRLPERLQRWRRHWAQESTTAEEFRVVSSGSLFAAFVEIGDYPARTNIGHEYRDLLKQQIENVTTLKCPNFGPSPIHPDFYIVLRKKSGEGIPLGTKTYTLPDEDILLVSDSGAGTIEEATTDLFRELEYAMFRFYDLQLGRMRLIWYNVEVFNHFGDLSAGVMELDSISWRRFLRHRRLSTEAKKNLSLIHRRLVEYGSAHINFSRNRNSCLNRIKENPIIGKIPEYFARMSQAESELPEALTPALSHFGQELQTLGSVRSTIIAAFLSALAGAFFYALISRFLSK